MNVRLRRWPIALVVVWALWPVSQSEADMKRDDLRPERVGSDAAWHNLEALAERQRADWPAIGPTETCFIRDELAGAMILKVTAHPGSDHLQYYDVPLWNADGSMMLIRSRTESRRFCLANGDGSHLRPSIVTDTRAFACWDPVHSGFVYHLTQGDERALTRLNVRTGEDEVVADLGHLEHQMRQAPLSPDGKHALLHAPPGEQYPCLLVSTAQGSVETVPAPLPVLRVRFSKAPDYSIFLNSGSGVERTTGFVQVPSGEFRPIHRGYASHPDMSPDGKLLSVFIHADDGVSRDWVLMDRTGTVVGRIPRMMGHQSWSPCGRFCVADGYAGASASGSQLDGGRVHGAIALIDPFSLTVWNLNRHMSDYGAGKRTGAFPGQDCHPHAQMSPDGTKAAYNSVEGNRFRPDLYVTYVRLPERPRNLVARRDPGGVRLTWDAPAHSRELKRYRIYRLAEGEVHYGQIGEAPKGMTTFLDNAPARNPLYAVTAEEYSRQESWPSDEAAPRDRRQCARYSLADEWRAALARRLTFDGDAPGYWAARVSGVDQIPAPEPPTGSLLWLCAKEDGADRPHRWLPSHAIDAHKWLVAAWGIYPDGRTPPQDSPLGATEPGVPRLLQCSTSDELLTLRWEPVEDARWYNVYLVHEAGSPLDNSTRIGSVAATTFVDVVGYQGGRAYRVTAIGRTGSESRPSEPITLDRAVRDPH